MSISKGQAILMDVLMIGLFISIILILGSYFGREFYNTQNIHEDSFYSQTVLLSLIKYENESYFGYESSGMNIAEIFDIFYCQTNQRISQAQLNQTIKWFLDLTLEDYNYIFWTRSETGKYHDSTGIHVWKGQSAVCAKQITVKNFDMNLSCGEAPLTLSIWDKFKEIPEVCD